MGKGIHVLQIIKKGMDFFQEDEKELVCFGPYHAILTDVGLPVTMANPDPQRKLRPMNKNSSQFHIDSTIF